MCGAAGDVVYWHGRTAHSPGIHTGPGVRLAVPHDLQKARSRSAGPPTGPPPEWFKDVPLYEHDRPPQEDMWEDWAFTVNAEAVGEPVEEAKAAGAK